MIANILSPKSWAKRTFAQADLGDKRRSKRTVEVAARIMRNPSASLPAQMGSSKMLKALYRLLREEDVTHKALMESHFQKTLQAARQTPLVLMVQDTTGLDYTHHPSTKGLSSIGNENGKGFLLQTVLAVVPSPRKVLGIAYQEPFLRKKAPEGEDCKKRQKRPRESQAWSRAAKAVGSPPRKGLWVHVGDRYSDIFEFMETCRQQGAHFLVRAAQDRRVEDSDEVLNHLFPLVRSLPAKGKKTIDLPATHKRAARRAHLRISFGPVTIKPPKHSPHKAPLDVWVIRVWEVNPPVDVEEPLEWILITSVPTQTLTEAWERVDWYTCRWVVEDYHQCLKTGCSMEERQLQDGEGLMRLLGLLAAVAVRLLQLREIARLNPERLAQEALPEELVRVVALLAGVSPKALTVGDLWRQVAQLGGYLGRRGDGPPGWKTLWRGWLYVQTLLEGVRLSARLPPSS